ncbi:MAG: DUF4202 domain-containing protein [Verrucomicrobiota bacterium]
MITLPLFRFSKAIKLFDEANAQDPNTEIVDGQQVPHEWIDAQRMTAWVLKLDPEASEPLQLAARCQHICRWKRPRSDYPEGRAAYLQWRKDLKTFHADTAAEILARVGYKKKVIDRVRKLNLKQEMTADPEVQTLEDALCLVFLEFEFADFCERKSDEMMVRILKKTWGKMSPQAREEAGRLDYNTHQQALLDEALTPE